MHYAGGSDPPVLQTPRTLLRSLPSTQLRPHFNHPHFMRLSTLAPRPPVLWPSRNPMERPDCRPHQATMGRHIGSVAMLLPLVLRPLRRPIPPYHRPAHLQQLMTLRRSLRPRLRLTGGDSISKNNSPVGKCFLYLPANYWSAHPHQQTEGQEQGVQREFQNTNMPHRMCLPRESVFVVVVRRTEHGSLHPAGRQRRQCPPAGEATEAAVAAISPAPRS